MQLQCTRLFLSTIAVVGSSLGMHAFRIQVRQAVELEASASLTRPARNSWPFSAASGNSFSHAHSVFSQGSGAATAPSMQRWVLQKPVSPHLRRCMRGHPVRSRAAWRLLRGRSRGCRFRSGESASRPPDLGSLGHGPPLRRDAHRFRIASSRSLSGAIGFFFGFQLGLGGDVKQWAPPQVGTQAV